jgi:hypothetical protein
MVIIIVIIWVWLGYLSFIGGVRYSEEIIMVIIVVVVIWIWLGYLSLKDKQSPTFLTGFFSFLLSPKRNRLISGEERMSGGLALSEA